MPTEGRDCVGRVRPKSRFLLLTVKAEGDWVRFSFKLKNWPLFLKTEREVQRSGRGTGRAFRRGEREAGRKDAVLGEDVRLLFSARHARIQTQRVSVTRVLSVYPTSLFCEQPLTKHVHRPAMRLPGADVRAGEADCHHCAQCPGRCRNVQARGGQEGVRCSRPPAPAAGSPDRQTGVQSRWAVFLPLSTEPRFLWSCFRAPGSRF